jgi:hypothetical protein
MKWNYRKRKRECHDSHRCRNDDERRGRRSYPLGLGMKKNEEKRKEEKSHELLEHIPPHLSSLLSHPIL